MNTRAAITVYRDRDEVERVWESPEFRPSYIAGTGARVFFKEAPGDRGTEIHVDLATATNGGLGRALRKLTGADELAKAKDDLRRFKQHVETGEIARSDAAPEGQLAERTLKQRPAQPLDDAELQQVGV